MSNLKLALIFLAIFNSCEFNFSDPKTKINQELSWSSQDEYPSTSDCDLLEEKTERIDCLKKHLIESISKNFDSTNFSLQSNIVDTIILTLVVDKQGAIKLYEFEKINDSYFDTDFRNKISDIINNMSSIIPANKTNLGLPVTSKFKLPIIINTKG